MITSGRNERERARLGLLAVALALASCAVSHRRDAAETLRVGKAVPEAFSFTPLDVGIRKDIFSKNGLEIEEIAFAGDAKLQQAMTSDSLDIGIGSGPALAFIVKGSPIKGVAAMAGPPLLLAIVVRPDGAKTVADLKGKKISVSTAGSLTYWLVSETSRRQGWGPNGIDIEPMGAMAGQIAALDARRHRRRDHGPRQRATIWKREAKGASSCASATSRSSSPTSSSPPTS